MKYVNYLPSSIYFLPLNDHKKTMPEFEITTNDCMEDCYNLYKTYNNKNILLINSMCPAKKGAGSQEKTISNVSTLSKYLDDIDETIGYPLYKKSKGIYIPGITINNEYEINILNVYSKPIDKIKTNDDFDYVYKNIFDLIFHIANIYHMDYIVMTPIGCGGYGHDPEIIAKWLKYYVNIYKLYTIKKIIISCRNENNFKSFSYHLC